MKQNQEKGLTPNEFLTLIENITDDGLVEGENFISHFNLAVDTINIELGTFFPNITEMDLDTVYPNLEIQPTLPIPLNELLGNQKTDIQSGKLSSAWPKWLKFLKLETIDNNEGYAYVKMDITGGDSVNNELGRNLYRFIIQFRTDNQIANPTEEAFKVYRLGGGILPLQFSIGPDYSVYVKNTERIGEVLKNININIITEDKSDNMNVQRIQFEEEGKDLEINSLIESRDYFTLDKFWLTSLFSELIQKSIKIAEGDTPELYYKHESTISRFLDKLRRQMHDFLPKEILPNKAENSTDYNTERYFR